MKVILTGARQVGKSTALRRFLSAYPGSVAGFRTEFSTREDPNDRQLLICPIPSGAAEVAVRWVAGKPEADLSAFDRCIPPLLRQKAELFVLDELGKFEGGAAEMRRAVEKLFDSAADVLAVVRLDAPGWMGALKERGGVTVLTVTEENRDGIPAALAKLLEKA